MNDPVLRVALVDDHAMVRQALASVLEDEPAIEVAAQASSAAGAIDLLRSEPPDVLILDYNLPDGGAPRVLAALEAMSVPTRVLILTMHDNPAYAVRALEGGALGFLVKSSAVEELVEALRTVHRGEIYVTPKLSAEVIDQLRRPRRERRGLQALSQREMELLRLIASGRGIKEAARELRVGVSTASTYRARLLKKLGLDSTSDLIRFALEEGLGE